MNIKNEGEKLRSYKPDLKSTEDKPRMQEDKSGN